MTWLFVFSMTAFVAGGALAVVGGKWQGDDWRKWFALAWPCIVTGWALFIAHLVVISGAK